MSEIPARLNKIARVVCAKLEAMPSAGNIFVVADELQRLELAAEQRGGEMEREEVAQKFDDEAADYLGFARALIDAGEGHRAKSDLQAADKMKLRAAAIRSRATEG